MKILITEDEKPARDKLIRMLKKIILNGEITGQTKSIKETVDWLQNNQHPDLAFFDIQLTDGLSFEIISSQKVSFPIIFVTAYDEYLLKAFHSFSIDYLLKPVKESDLKAALDQYNRFKEYFSGSYKNFLDHFNNQKLNQNRILAQKGGSFIPIQIEEIAYFFTQYKLTFLITKDGSQLRVDSSLTDLESKLDSLQFYRANRQYVVNADAIYRVRPYGKGRLQLTLSPPSSNEIIVSQEKASEFKQWLGS